MSKKAWGWASCMALVVLLSGACQPGPVPDTATPLPATAVPTAAARTMPPVSPAPTEIALTGNYLGQTPPGSTPEIFAPDIISVMGRYEYGLAVSPDGDEMFFTAEDPGQGLMVVRRVDGRWTEPEVANLRGNNSWEFEAFYTVDGRELFFTSGRMGASRLWYVEKGADGWGQARRLDSPVNEAEVFWATFTNDDTLYYTNVGELGIYRARQVDGAYPETEDIGFPVGSVHPFVAPDESFLLFNSSKLGGAGASDIFISFRQGDGTWGQPVNMGPEINTTYFETCPSLSPDGRYIFFSRYNEPDGKSNIYWASSAIIEQLGEAAGAAASPAPQPGTSSLSFVESGQALGDGDLAVALGDLDGDGDLDAVTIYWERPGRVWLNDGVGVFSDSGQSLVDGGSVALGDLDGDGDLDAFVGRGRDNGLPSEVWLNDGAGTFRNSGQRLGNKVAMAVALGDVDGDGDLDAVIANFHDTSYTAQPNEVWLNDGTATFADSGQRLGHAVSAGVALGDLDRDGDMDILFANTGEPGTNEIWLNQGGAQGGTVGVFEASEQALGARSTLALGDLDGDGDPDALEMGGGTSSGTVWLNDGTGAFSDSGQSLSNPGGAGAWWVALGDLDGDGDLDAFVACGDGRGLGDLPDTPNVIWLNDGTGVLSDSGLRLGNADSQGVALGDLDGDGDLDAFVVNSDTPGEVWMNETSPVESAGCDYLGETRPGTTPVIFGEGRLSVAGKNTHTIAFSPACDQLIFSRFPDTRSFVLMFADGQWSELAAAFFDGMEASFSPDGNRLFFHGNYDIYYVERNGATWGDPVSVGSAINSEAAEFYPSVTSDGTLFFSRNGNWDEARLMVSELIDGRYSAPVDLGLPINNGGALHAYVAPDESYMIFNSPRAGSYTQLDLWIAYRNADGAWTEPRNLGEAINSGADANLCPVVSPDGQFLFFTKLDWEGNNTGTGTVYWVRTDFIAALR